MTANRVSLTLARGAFALLGDYRRKLDQVPAGQMGSRKWAPILAAKISLLLHVFSAHPGNEIAEATMHTGIELAECLLRESASTARDCLTEQEGIDLEDQLDRMEEKIKELSRLQDRRSKRSGRVQQRKQRHFLLDGHRVTTSTVQSDKSQSTKWRDRAIGQHQPVMVEWRGCDKLRRVFQRPV
jgi:hypothetical protein